MEDAEILTLAARDKRLVITMDTDFGELIYCSGRSHAGVLLLRLDDADSLRKVETVREIFLSYGSQLTGAFSVYHSGRLRIRNI